MVELRILELLALGSRIVFAISVGTVTTIIALLFLLVSNVLIFEELLFVKLVVFLGLLVFRGFDVVEIFLNTTRAVLVGLVAHAVLVLLGLVLLGLVGLVGLVVLVVFASDGITAGRCGIVWNQTLCQIGDCCGQAPFLQVVDRVV
jgi:hypothetical protein